VHAPKGQQHPIEKSRELQRKLYRAAKKCRDRRFHALYDRVFRPDILWRPWQEVRANGGRAGIDGVTLEEVERLGVSEFLQSIEADLKARRYRPKPVLRVYIPKPDGRQRPLGIPTVRDRVVQQACKIVIEPIFEANFQDQSYGFRPKRSAAQAVRKIDAALVRGWWVVDADIQGYFDSINHDLLMNLVQRRVSDRRVLKLLLQWLKAGVVEEGLWRSTEVGSPQGGVITPRTQKITLNLSGGCGFGGNRVRIDVCRKRLYVYDRCRAPTQPRRPSASIAHGSCFGKSINFPMRSSDWHKTAPFRRVKPTATSNTLSN
jgi:RNA-directed DNA polymerase